MGHERNKPKREKKRPKKEKLAPSLKQTSQSEVIEHVSQHAPKS